MMHTVAKQRSTITAQDPIELRSRAVSLTVLELDVNKEILIPAYFLANLLSPALWQWRQQRRAFDANGRLLSEKRRCRELERHFRRYAFTHYPDCPGGDPWGLLFFPAEEQRLGKEYIRQVRQEYDQTLRRLLETNAESQFGQIVLQDYYHQGYFPRLRNEIIDVMDAYRRVSPKGSGKCAALTMLWAAALCVWARFPLENIYIIGNKAHMFAFLDEGDGHLFNNTKWFHKVRIHNASELSEFVRMVTTDAETTFFYNPVWGMCRCYPRESGIPIDHLQHIFRRLEEFLGIPLKHPNPAAIRSLPGACCSAIPDPLRFDSVEAYQQHVFALAQQRPDSVYDYARYAFRSLDVPLPQAYVRAALRDYHTAQRAATVQSLEDAFRILETVPDRESIFHSRTRIALPDEVLFFRTGSDRDRALLLFTLLRQSPIGDLDSEIVLTPDRSYVRYRNQWIDAETLMIQTREPSDAVVVFDEQNAFLRSEGSSR